MIVSLNKTLVTNSFKDIFEQYNWEDVKDFIYSVKPYQVKEVLQKKRSYPS